MIDSSFKLIPDMLCDVHIWAPGQKWQSSDLVFSEPCSYIFRSVFQIIILLKEYTAFQQALIMDGTQESLLQDSGIFELIHGSLNAKQSTKSKFRDATPYHN